MASSVKFLHCSIKLFDLKVFCPSLVPKSQAINCLQFVEPNLLSNMSNSFLTAMYDVSGDSPDTFLQWNKLSAIITPLIAPHIPQVLETPEQKPVAIFGIKSDSIPLLSATESKTLSAQ